MTEPDLILDPADPGYNLGEHLEWLYAQRDATEAGSDEWHDINARLGAAIGIHENHERAGITCEGMTATQWRSHYANLFNAHQHDLQRISEWQKRTNAEKTIEFAVETADGIRFADKGHDHATASRVAACYDGSHVVTRTITPWKRTAAATTTDN